jgi:RNA polymerase sigma factor (sigma-70 family)
VDNRKNKIISSNWEDTWRRFKSGDKEAFVIIYNAHIDFLYSYGTKMTVNTELVEDAVQDLFLYLLSSRDHITTPQHIRYYLLKAFKRILMDKIMKERLYSPAGDQETFYLNVSLDLDDPGDLQIKEKKIQMVEELIDQLDAQKKEVLFLKFYSGLSYAEIADIVGMKASSAKKLVYRVISLFREILQKKLIELFMIFCRK